MVDIREADIQDVQTIAHLHLSGWQGAYGGIVDGAYLDSITLEDKIQQWSDIVPKDETRSFIAERDGKPAGFINFGKLMTPPPGTSRLRPLYAREILALYLLPEYYRQGVGKALMQKAVSCILEDGFSSLCLWVLEKNTRGKNFYEAMGGQRIGKQMIEIGGCQHKEICFGWRDIKEIL